VAQDRPLTQILAALNDAAAATWRHLRLMGTHRSGGFGRGAGQSDRNDEVKVGERSPALVEA
jgi:hypothetical protein